MTHYTLTVNHNNLILLNEIYQNHLIQNNNEHVDFSALHNGIKITAYKSGKIVLQGDEVTSELIAIKTVLGLEDYEAIGSDEVGTGDVFGPVVVCSAYTSIEDLKWLESLNVRDSKNIKDDKILELGPLLANKLTHTIMILSPKKYNEIHAQGNNLNKIKAILHNHVIIKTTAKVKKPVPVILDQFCQSNLYFNYLKEEKFIYHDIEFQIQAESFHLSVAAASIIARYAFLAKMNEYSETVGFELKKGANQDVDNQISEIHEKFGKKGLSGVAKMHFQNVTKLGF